MPFLAAGKAFVDLKFVWFWGAPCDDDITQILKVDSDAEPISRLS